jgi:predicted nucleotidyltransferase component of viral defense system
VIPNAYIQAWTQKAPWPLPSQVEQDLIICRAFCDLFSSQKLAGKLAFRGGTAINKLLFEKPLRYSEDIDLVQTKQEGIGDTVDAIRQALKWLGDFNYKQAAHSIHLFYKFAPEDAPDSALKVKVEINTREHETVYGLKTYGFELSNEWHKANVEIASFEKEELFGTKLRALLQRRKNRDLFDLNEGLKQLSLDPEKVVACMQHYLGLQEQAMTRAVAEQRMLEKLQQSLTEDIAPLLPAGVTFTDAEALSAFGKVWNDLIALIPGEPWKLSEKIIGELREKRLPNLLK